MLGGRSFLAGIVVNLELRYMYMKKNTDHGRGMLATGTMPGTQAFESCSGERKVMWRSLG